jgi:hypothetical protein
VTSVVETFGTPFWVNLINTPRSPVEHGSGAFKNYFLMKQTRCKSCSCYQHLRQSMNWDVVMKFDTMDVALGRRFLIINLPQQTGNEI